MILKSALFSISSGGAPRCGSYKLGKNIPVEYRSLSYFSLSPPPPHPLLCFSRMDWYSGWARPTFLLSSLFFFFFFFEKDAALGSSRRIVKSDTGYVCARRAKKTDAEKFSTLQVVLPPTRIFIFISLASLISPSCSDAPRSICFVYFPRLFLRRDISVVYKYFIRARRMFIRK